MNLGLLQDLMAVKLKHEQRNSMAITTSKLRANHQDIQIKMNEMKQEYDANIQT